MGCKRTREELGPNPNPEIWMDVKTKEGWYRKKRPKKNAKLNSVMQGHADAMELTMPAAKKLIDKLEPWVRGLELGRIRSTIGSRLKKSYLEKGRMDFTYLQDVDIQPRRTMKALLKPRPKVFVTNEVAVSVHTYGSAIRIVRSIYTEYYFELIMLWGDVTKENGLRVDSVESPLYPKDTEEVGKCDLKIDIPNTDQPWMALLKVGCLEEEEQARHPRHYAVKVVAVGGGVGN